VGKAFSVEHEVTFSGKMFTVKFRLNTLYTMTVVRKMQPGVYWFCLALRLRSGLAVSQHSVS